MEYQLLHAHNMEVMARYPDDYFDLALVDPEYGLNFAANPHSQSKIKHTKKAWDKTPPPPEYFTELFRVSKNQIIWGGNYFGLPASQGFFIWDKKQPEDFSMAMCEYAYSSFQKPAKIFRSHVHLEKNKIHPTQKPVALYTWLLHQAKALKTWKVIDTHGGSFNSAVACHNFGISEFVGCELDPENYANGRANFEQKIKQSVLF